MFLGKKLAVFGIALLLAGICSAPAQAAAVHSGVTTVSVDLSGHNPAGEAELWLPYPVSDNDQTITDIKVSGDFAASAVYTDKTYSTPMLYARWNQGAASRKLVFSFKTERKEVIRRDFPAKEAAWDRADFAQYLAPSSIGPTDGEVGRLAKSITAGKTTVLEKAKAIYDWTCENTYRDPATRGCGAGDVCALLAKPGASALISIRSSSPWHGLPECRAARCSACAWAKRTRRT